LKYLNVPNVYVFLIIACLASLMPDMDKEESKVGKRVKPLSWVLEKLFGHRNLFHSIFPLLAILALFFYVLGWNVAGAAMLIGYASHLLIDSLNFAGIAPFYPLSTKRIVGFVKTGGIVEHVLFFIILIADAVLLLRTF